MIQTFAIFASLVSSLCFVYNSVNNGLIQIAFNFIGLFSVCLLFFNLWFLVLSFNKKLLQYGFCALCFLTSFLLIIQTKDGYIITPEILYATLHQDRNEILDIISLSDGITVAISCLICYFAFKLKNKITFKITKKYLLAAFCLLFVNALIAIASGFFIKHNSQKKNSMQMITFIKNAHLITPINFFASLSINISSAMSKNNEVMLPINVSVGQKNKNNDLKVYYIIGESGRFDRFSINGYSKNTTPNLAKYIRSGNLINFSQTNQSCGITTFLSVPCMLSGSSDGTKYDLLKIFKQAKYKTILRSPNSNHIFKTIRKSLFINSEFVANNYLNDAEIIKYIKSDLKSNKTKMFSVIQMLGSHSIYGIEKSIQNKNNIFEPYCTQHSLRDCNLMLGKKHLDNSYDNTIVYTDEILNEIFEALNNENAIVFFAPDHAELLGENGYFGHGVTLADGTNHKKQYEIPVFIWVSNKYIKLNPLKYRTMLKNTKNKATNHLELYNSIIACNDIEVEGLLIKKHYCR